MPISAELDVEAEFDVSFRVTCVRQCACRVWPGTLGYPDPASPAPGVMGRADPVMVTV